MNFLIINSDAEAAELLARLLKRDLEERISDDVCLEILADIAEENLLLLAGTNTCVIMEIETEDGRKRLNLAWRLREADEQIPIVFYTKTNDYAMECYDLDLTYYLLNPADEVSVHRMVTRVLRQFEMMSK